MQPRMPETQAIVFVVDDDASVREALERLVRSAGLRVEAFASAEEFLTRPQADAPSCLVLDVQLPDLNGLDLQRRMVDANADIPIVFITGHGDIPTTVRAMKAGAVEFLTKPLVEGDVLESIRQAIARDRAARDHHADNGRAARPVRLAHAARGGGDGVGGFWPAQQAHRRGAWHQRGDRQSASRPRDAQDGGRLPGRAGQNVREAWKTPSNEAVTGSSRRPAPYH